MDTLKINVTAEDSDAARAVRERTLDGLTGVYNAESHCPLAFALRRMGYTYIRVRADRLIVGQVTVQWDVVPRDPKHYRVTPTMFQAIRRWDRQWRFTPHTFVAPVA